MKKTEKYRSFHEMKESSTSVSPANAAVVRERHEKFADFIGSFKLVSSNSRTTKKKKVDVKR